MGTHEFSDTYAAETAHDADRQAFDRPGSAARHGGRRVDIKYFTSRSKPPAQAQQREGNTETVPGDGSPLTFGGTAVYDAP